jgi:hypothetical protein
MPTNHKVLSISSLFLLGLVLTQPARAISVTQTGTLAADNSVFTYNLTVTITQSYVLWTTSYGGGTNLDGSTSASGGLVPVLTLFSASSGNAVNFDGADGVCMGAAHTDSSTGMCDDAFIITTLPAGSYVLDLTEFPNVAIGNLSSGFLFSSDPTATGDTCGGASTGHMFVQADLSACPQRTSSYTLNIANVPEPASFWLGVPVILVVLFRKRLFRRLSTPSAH